MGKVLSYLEADGGTRRHWGFLFHTGMPTLIRRKQRRRVTYRTLWAQGDVIMSPIPPQAVVSLRSSWTHVYPEYPEAHPHPGLWDALSPVPCSVFLVSFLMYFSRLYPQLEMENTAQAKSWGKKQTQETQGKIRCLYPTLQSMDEQARSVRDSKCTPSSLKGLYLLWRQGLDHESFENKQITTHFNRQIRHWRRTIESSLGWPHTVGFSGNLNFNI